jgi:hypothetical protein
MITFENIKTGEKVSFHGGQDPETRQAHMAAYLNSSNLHPNALKGQDFGWRLAPEIVAEMDRVRTDPQTLDMLARRIGVSIDDVRDFHVLNYVAEMDFAKDALAQRAKNESTDYERKYNERLAAIRDGEQLVSENSDSSNQTDSAKIKEPKSTNKEK